MAISLNKTFNDLSKHEPLDGNNFKQWSKNRLVFFEQLEVDCVLFKEPSMNGSNTNTDPSNVITVEDVVKKKFEKDNKIGRGHFLNHMANTLFDLFSNYKYAKEIWDSFEKKYDVDDAGKKKYVVCQWIKFQMVDNKPIMEQVSEYENLTSDFLNEDMKICEIFQANVLL